MTKELLRGWVQATTDELLSFVTSGSRGWAKYYSDQGAAFIRVGNFDRHTVELDLAKLQRVSPPKNAEGARTLVLPNDLLVTITADIGMIAVVPEGIEEAYVNQHVALARPVLSETSRYLGWFLASQHGQQQLGLLNKGATKAGLGLDDIRRVSVPLPPLAEQRRIVAKIEELLERGRRAREALEAIPALLERYRQSILAAAFQGDLTAEWREHHKVAADQTIATIRLARAKTTPKRKSGANALETGGRPAVQFGDIPDTWAAATLEEVTDPSRVIQYGILMPGPDVVDGVRYVKVMNIKNDVIDVGALRRTTTDIHQKYIRASLAPGDVLLTIRGTYGRVAIVPEELSVANITQDTARIAVLPGMDAEYMAWYLRSPACQAYFRAVAKGMAVKGVNIGDIRPMEIPVPPVEEQREIVRQITEGLGVIDGIRLAVKGASQRTSTLTQSILAKAFRGELVPQHPNDEPASVLLDRIRAERAVAGDKPKRGRRAKA